MPASSSICGADFGSGVFKRQALAVLAVRPLIHLFLIHQLLQDMVDGTTQPGDLSKLRARAPDIVSQCRLEHARGTSAPFHPRFLSAASHGGRYQLGSDLFTIKARKPDIPVSTKYRLSVIV